MLRNSTQHVCSMMIVGLMALAGLGVRSGQGAEKPTSQVTVYLRDGEIANPELLHRAQAIAASAFAGIGVRFRWEFGSPRPVPRGSQARACHTRTEIVLRLVSGAPHDFHPGALAYAFPYAQSGVRITVFYDRVLAIAAGQIPSGAVLLAHVTTHEIAHVLQGVALHSETGTMKAQWTNEDYVEMRLRPLPFSPYDARLIHRGLDSGNCEAEVAVSVNSSPQIR